MKIPGGYLPNVAGRPSGEVVAPPMPVRVRVAPPDSRAAYRALVTPGQAVLFGDALAEADWPGADSSSPRRWPAP